ncbi:MAG: hypothetical protein AAFV90_21790 [Cyanobacteria bacterium J06634_5]
MTLPKTSFRTEVAPVPIHWSRGIVVRRKFELGSTNSYKQAKTQKTLHSGLSLQLESPHVNSFAPHIFSATTAERQFNQLAQEWRANTALLSDLSKKSMHPAYQRIIGMGQEVLPLLLKELERRPGHWFWALGAITGANPVKPENRGRMKRMAQDWLEWGRDHGYQW